MSSSIAYINLLNQIGPSDINRLGAKAIKIADKTERAKAMLKMAEQLGIKVSFLHIIYFATEFALLFGDTVSKLFKLRLLKTTCSFDFSK